MSEVLVVRAGAQQWDTWTEVRIHDLYNDTTVGTSNNAPGISFQAASMVQDPVVARVIAMHNNQAPGADAAMWMGEEIIYTSNAGDDPFLQSSDEGGVTGILGRTMVLDAHQMIDVADLPSATMISGIGMGFSPVVPIAASPTQPLILLYARWNTPVYELLLAKGSGTSTVLALTNVAAPTVNRMDHLRIIYVPNQYVEGYINGKFGGRISATAALAPKFPNPATVASPTGFNAFAQSGSDNLGSISAAWWNCRYRVAMA